MTYTTLSGHQIEYDAAPKLARFIGELEAMCRSAGETEDAMIARVYSVDNPIMDTQAIPGRGAVTAKVLANPAYRVMTDLIFRKRVAEQGVDVEKLAGRYTLSVPQVAERLGVHVSAVRQAIEAGRIGAWVKYGRTYVDPAALASFRLSPRGPKPKIPRVGALGVGDSGKVAAARTPAARGPLPKHRAAANKRRALAKS
jgi:excisionase family DNA binding protein